ncbi:hypothetical protein CONPUDRAFT_75900 [Coniophora puteana RWD-64-598 SS2]|uniref:DUF6533 domain-containing protein n=1 Tax=Coniophora puteana (strain RWD-64-598) TaxID=741705 RepID=A0A5M3MER2_CONPW|nr:uncharacterized protein CONPUDRAFT_75900 [Coniophora puteana RWD-64-598 SS2]EIW77095.1 hypothetical protein CONPUDRAFT_75900 [Coniophora puteana RWD-64-598 SS2]
MPDIPSSSAEVFHDFIFFQVEDYVVASVATLVVYDYVLCLSQEVDLIWKHKLSWVTWCYACVSYTITRNGASLRIFPIEVFDGSGSMLWGMLEMGWINILEAALQVKEVVLMGIPYCKTFGPTSPPGWLDQVASGIVVGFEIILFIMLAYRSIWHFLEQRSNDSTSQFNSIAQHLFQQGLLYIAWWVL